MRTRFCIAEVGLPLTTATTKEILENLLFGLVDLIGICRGNQQEVARWSELDYVEILPGERLCDMIYTPDRLDDTLRMALLQAIDGCKRWDADDESLSTAAVQIDGTEVTAPSVAWAHAEQAAGRAVACLCVEPAERGLRSVKLAGHMLKIHFLSNGEPTKALSDFYRTVPDVEDLDEDSYISHANWMFPALFFKPGIAQEFRRFSDSYRALRQDITRHLGALNDHFQSVFSSHHGDPSATSKEMQARCGIDMSTESPNTKRNKKAWEERRITVNGQSLYCDWHTKLEPNKNRIHFHPAKDKLAGGKVVIGIFHEHLAT